MRHSLIDRELSADRGGEPEVRAVGDDELLSVLNGTFGLELPPGTRFPVRAGG